MDIYLAATPSYEVLEVIKQSTHKHILLSYFYLKSLSTSRLDETMAFVKENNIKLFLDSGAFSFRSNKSFNEKFAKMSTIEKYTFYKDFTEKYVGFIKKYYDDIYCYAELDIDTIIGFHKVLELRKYFPKEILGKFCAVFHAETRTLQDFKNDCDTFKYQAVGTSSQGTIDEEKLGKLAKYAYKNGNKLHGFALVNNSLLKNVPLASVDSSTWNSGVKYGHIHYFSEKEGRLKVFHYKDPKSIHKHMDRLRVQNPDFVKMWEVEGDPKKVSRVYRLASSALAYHKLEDYLTRLWEARGIKWDN